MPKMQPINRLKGFRDILPEDSHYWDFAISVIESVAQGAGLEKIEVPMLEKSDLFLRSVGEETDVVSKEMYVFDGSKNKGTSGKKDKEEQSQLALRPELTAGIVRAYIENGMQVWPKPVSLYTIGRCFRHENPQSGRFREFTQCSVEIFGESDPTIDANTIGVSWQMLTDMRITSAEININSMGCSVCRPRIKKILTDFFKKKESKLCDDCKKRLKKNPLRILDCKNEKCQALIAVAPLMIENICEDCKGHFMSVLEYLDEMGVPYNLAPNLVRGFDYYNRTVFEIITKNDTKRQNALGGGGRYDCLVEELGGEMTPAIGFGLGIDRIVEHLKTENIRVPKPKSKINVYVIHLGEESKKIALQIVKNLRKIGISVGMAVGKDTIKAQMKAADKVNALFSVIIGQREAVTNVALVRDMRDGIQETVELKELTERVFNMVEERKAEEEDYRKNKKIKK
ncbi:histidine--tRNA ligase [Candidatus Microgenomates bacterium]|nr:histidine--tRNA ligase [Candidatus Microgenomates bacterium]